MKFNSLKELRDQINKVVVGQPELIDAVTICLYRHLLKVLAVRLGYIQKSNSNLLIIGETGTGKTFAVKETTKALGFPLIEINSKSISQEGWSGSSFVDILGNAINDLMITGQDIKYSVVFMDEFDKLCIPNPSSNDANTSFHLQASILKYIEGFNINTRKFNVDSSNFCFIFAGAFGGMAKKDIPTIGFNSEPIKDTESITKKLLNFGLIEELIGRITRIVKTNDFTREMYRDLLMNENFVSNQWFKLFDNLNLKYSRNLNYSAILTDAVDKKLGARGLIQVLEATIDDVIEQNFDNIQLQEAMIKHFDANSSS